MGRRGFSLDEQEAMAFLRQDRVQGGLRERLGRLRESDLREMAQRQGLETVPGESRADLAARMVEQARTRAQEAANRTSRGRRTRNSRGRRTRNSRGR